MHVQITRWGNSLGLRLPKALASQIGLQDGQKVSITTDGTRLIIDKAPPAYQLADLLHNVTPDAMREAFDWAKTLAVKPSMIDPGYTPDAGHLIWTDFDPRTGREQAGRPAVIISPMAFSRASGFAIVCPVTSTLRHFGSSVILPPGLPVSGEILTSHVRCIDIGARPIRYAGANVPSATLTEIRAKLAILCGMEP